MNSTITQDIDFTSIEKSPKEIINSFTEITGYSNEVVINGGEQFTVGKKVSDRNSGREKYPLFHHPSSSSANEFAGELIKERDPYGNYYILFKKRDQEEGKNSKVNALEVRDHSREQDLNNILTQLREELTNKDWEQDGIVRVSYEEKLDANMKLVEFIEESDKHSFNPQTMMIPQVMDGINEYPLDAQELMFYIQEGITINLSNKLKEVTPEQIREALIDYYNSA